VNGLRRDDDREYYSTRKRKAVQIDPTWNRYNPCDSSFEAQAAEEVDNPKAASDDIPEDLKDVPEAAIPSNSQKSPNTDEPIPPQMHSKDQIGGSQDSPAKPVRPRRRKRQRLRKSQAPESSIFPGVS